MRLKTKIIEELKENKALMGWVRFGIVVFTIGLYPFIGFWAFLVMFLLYCLYIIWHLWAYDYFSLIKVSVEASKAIKRAKKNGSN